MSRNSITIKQIAEKTGYSYRTICRVLNQKGGVHKAATREAVLAAAQELGYIPNANARAMRSGRCNAIGLLLSTVRSRSHLPALLLDGIQSRLAASGMHLTLASTPDERLTDPAYVPTILQQWMVDGLLVNYTYAAPPELVRLVREHRVPSVWINSRGESDCVYADEFNAAWRATEHLIGLGHRKIAYVDYHTDYSRESFHYSVRDRQAGYAQAMGQAGLEPRVICEQRELTPPERAAAACTWLAGAERPTAVVAYSMWTAVPVWVAATTRLRLRVPADLSLMMFSDLAAHEAGLAVTMMQVPEYEMGMAAVEMLLAKIATPGQAQPSRCLAAKLVEGETTGRPG